MSTNLGERIAEILKNKNIRQKDLADRIGVTEATISRYIAGEREPKPEVLANIATALNTTSDYLLDIENDDFDYPKVKRMIGRNASAMTDEEKRELINALFGGD